MSKLFLSLLLLFVTGFLNADNTNQTQDQNLVQVQITEHFWIPLSDGTRLAARMWIPSNANEQQQVPAILEYIPYGKRHGTRGRDEPMHYWFASQGYAAIRVDMRGSGDSDGFLDDEYLKLEQDDALEVIDWIAKQSWCTGSVGMMGKSWGAFNSLQVAARRPPALKAIISVCTSDDRYNDDIHYMGGCLLNDNLWWGSFMLAYQARPSDPELVGDTWKQQWLDRIEQMPFWPALWMKNQHRNDYWKQGSICEDWNAIQCPVLVTGGWVDAYTNSVPRILENLKVPRLGIIGPWAHVYPHSGTPGPAIGFLQESCRWWDYWLKGIDNGIMTAPLLRAYMEEWTAPTGWYDPSPGRWVGETTWPSTQITSKSLYFTDAILTADSSQAGDTELAICSCQWTGSAVGEWMATGIPGELPTDQQADDQLSLTFDSAPLDERVEILGNPELILNISSDKPIANLCARLCDVAQDGSSRRISYQVLNLTHHESHSDPKDLEPGKFYTIKLKLKMCGYAFDPGHRIRIALSTTYWPLIWPSPSAATLTLRTKGSVLNLPIRPYNDNDRAIQFETPVSGPATPITQLSKGKVDRSFSVDPLTGCSTYITDCEGGVFGEGIERFDDIDITIAHNLKRELKISAEDPLSAHYVLTQSYNVSRPNWDIKIHTTVEMSSNETCFFLQGKLEAFENGNKCATKIFKEDFPRNKL